VDVLDLDWAPAVLERVCELAGLDGVYLDALRQATEGDDSVIDLGFLDTHPHAIGPFGPPPTALSAAQVARVSELLGQIDFPAVLAGLPTDAGRGGPGQGRTGACRHAYTAARLSRRGWCGRG
jgi:hypothetical protein